MQVFSNHASSTIPGAIDNSQTTITVATGEGDRFQSPTNGDYELLTIWNLTNKEVVKVTARTGDVLTVERGQEDTPAVAFAAGANIEGLITAGTLEQLGQLGAGTPPAQVSNGNIVGNNGETPTFEITNNDAGFNYTLTPSDPAVFTANKVGSTVTITLLDVSETKNETLTINVSDPAASFSSDTVISVTNHNVDYSDADDLIQITDFAKWEQGRSNFDLVNGLTATANGAHYRTTPFEQAGADGNWDSHTAKLRLQSKILSLTASAAGSFSSMEDPSAEVILVNDVGAEFTKTLTANVVTAGNETIESMTSSDNPWASGLNTRGSYLTPDGARLFTVNGSDYISWKDLATPNVLSSGGATQTSDNMELKQANTMGGIVGITFTGDGLTMYTLEYWAYASNYSGLIKWSLTEAFNPNTASVVDVFQPSSPTTSAGFGHSDVHADISVTHDGRHLYLTSGGAQGSQGATGYLYHFDLEAQPFGPDMEYTSFYSHASYNFRGVHVSPKGDYLSTVWWYDDLGNYYRHQVHKLGTDGVLTGMTTVVNGSWATLDDTERFFFSHDGREQYVCDGGGGNFYQKTRATPFWDTPHECTYDNTGVTGNIVGIYPKPIAPTVKVPAEILEVNLDHTSAPAIAANEPVGLYAPVNGVITRDIPYTLTACDARFVQLAIDCNIGINIVKAWLELTIVGGMGTGPAPATYEVTDFENNESVNSGYTYNEDGELVGLNSGSIYVSQAKEKGGGDPNWATHQLILTLESSEITLPTFTNNECVTSSPIAGVSKDQPLLVIDNVGAEHQACILRVMYEPEVVHTNGSPGVLGAWPTDDKGTFVNAMYGASVTPDGKTFISSDGTNPGNIAYLTVGSAWSDTVINANSHTLSGAAEYLAGMAWSPDQTQILTVGPNNEGVDKLLQWDLSTAGVVTSASKTKSADLKTLAGAEMNAYNGQYANVFVSYDGWYLYYSDAGNNCIFQFKYGTKKDIATLSYIGKSPVAAGGLRSCIFSPDNKTVVIAESSSIDVYLLNDPDDISQGWVLQAGNIGSGGESTGLHGVIGSPDGMTFYTYGINEGVFVRNTTATPLWNSEYRYRLEGTVPANPVEYYPRLSVPTVKVAIADVAGNLNHTTAPTIAASNTPALFTREYGRAKKEITYTQTAGDFGAMQFRLESTDAMTVSKVEMHTT